MQEAAVLGAAAEEVLAVLAHELLRGPVAGDGQSLGLLEDDLALLVQDGQLAGRLLEGQGDGAVGHDDGVIGLVHARLRMGVLARAVGLGLDLRDMIFAARRGVVRELAGQVDVVAEDPGLEERDLGRHVVVEGDVGHVRGRLVDARGDSRSQRALEAGSLRRIRVRGRGHPARERERRREDGADPSPHDPCADWFAHVLSLPDPIGDTFGGMLVRTGFFKQPICPPKISV